MIKKAIAVGALVVAAFFAAPAAAMADPYAPIPSEQTQVVAPGSTVTLTTAGWLPGELVTITYPDSFTLAASTTRNADSAGALTLSFHGSSSPGSYQVVFSNGTNTVTFTTVVTSLPATGVNDPGPTLWLAGGFLIVGGGLVATFIGIRRQRARRSVEA